MKNNIGTKAIKLFLLSAALAAWCPPAPTQAQLTPIPEAARLKPQKPWFQWLAGVAIIGVICVAAFKNPKRNS
jgi:hypothetical protein